LTTRKITDMYDTKYQSGVSMPYGDADTVGDIIPRISEILPKLRRSERKVAEMIRANLSSVAATSAP
jgi:hypothetical protein